MYGVDLNVADRDDLAGHNRAGGPGTGTRIAPECNDQPGQHSSMHVLPAWCDVR